MVLQWICKVLGWFLDGLSLIFGPTNDPKKHGKSRPVPRVDPVSEKETSTKRVCRGSAPWHGGSRSVVLFGSRARFPLRETGDGGRCGRTRPRNVIWGGWHPTRGYVPQGVPKGGYTKKCPQHKKLHFRILNRCCWLSIWTFTGPTRQ